MTARGGDGEGGGSEGEGARGEGEGSRGEGGGGEVVGGQGEGLHRRVRSFFCHSSTTFFVELDC